MQVKRLNDVAHPYDRVCQMKQFIYSASHEQPMRGSSQPCITKMRLQEYLDATDHMVHSMNEVKFGPN